MPRCGCCGSSADRPLAFPLSFFLPPATKAHDERLSREKMVQDACRDLRGHPLRAMRDGSRRQYRLGRRACQGGGRPGRRNRRRPRAVGGEGRSEEHTSELQSLMRISYAVFCLKKKKTYIT